MHLFSKIIKYLDSPAVKHIGIYTITNFLTRASSFLLLFVFTNPKYISPSENGLLSIFNNSILLILPVIQLGIIHSSGADFFKFEKQKFVDSFVSGFYLSFFVALSTFLFIPFFHDEIKSVFGLPDVVIYIIPAVAFFIFCIEQMLTIARNNNDPVVFLKANLFRLIIDLGLSVLLVVVFSYRWQGRVAGFFIANMFTAVFAFIYFLRKGYLKGSIKKEYLKSELIYSLPIIALQYSFFALYSSDKYFISYFQGSGSSVVGVYSIASIFASVIFAFRAAIIQYLTPKIYVALANSEPDYKSLKTLFRFLFVSMGSITLLLIVFTPLVYHFYINKEYHSGLDYFYLLCLGYFIWSLTSFLNSFLIFRKEKKKILLMSLLAIIVSLAGNYYFIREYGAFGGGVSVFFSFLLVFIVSIVLVFKDITRMLSGK
jgi:O-antigen/teichoic acid export membrane protein